MVLLPLFLLIFLNAQIHKALKKREEFKASLTRAIPSSREDEDKKKERDFTVTKILVAIVVMFCICQSFKVSDRDKVTRQTPTFSKEVL